MPIENSLQFAAALSKNGVPFEISMRLTDTSAAAAPDANAAQAGSRHRPPSWGVQLRITAPEPVDAVIRVRVPAWVADDPIITLDGWAVSAEAADGFLSLQGTWTNSTVDLTLPTAIQAVAIPDEPGTVAFLNGPVVLAGECDFETTLVGNDPAALLVPDNERQWGEWLQGFRTVGQDRAIRFRPLNELVDQRYCVYFPTAQVG